MIAAMTRVQSRLGSTIARRLPLAAAAIVAMFLVSGVSAALPLGPVAPAGSSATIATSAASSAAAARAATTAPSGSHGVPTIHAASGGGNGSNGTHYVENGTGTFFYNTAVQNVTTGHASCAYYRFLTYKYEYCWNATEEPTLNVTTSGTTGMAYTVWTNDTACPSLAVNASTEIGFVSSTNFGSTWGTPKILGNPLCATDAAGDENYSSAYSPTLTSLANGTFVLAYIEANISVPHYYYYESVYPMDLGCYYTAHDRMVVTESYNNGSTWTIPQVLQQTDITSSSYDCANPGVPLVRPSITATGDTVYLAYTEYPWYFEDCCNYTVPYEAFLHVLVSNNSGVSWTNASVPPTISGLNTGSQISAYPNLLVTPNGTLYMSYATGYDLQFGCAYYGTSYDCADTYNSSLEVAWSTTNGSSWSFSTVTTSANILNYYDYNTNFLSGPWSQLAYNPKNGQVYVTWAGTQYGVWCYYYSTGSYCDYFDPISNVWFSNSSTAGATWSAPRVVDPGFENPDMGPMNSAYLPSMSVLPDGQIDLEYSAVNATVCAGYECGGATEEFVYSANNGTSWSIPATVDDAVTTTGCSPCTYGSEEFMGVQSAMATAGGQVLLAWPKINDNAFGYAYWIGEGSVNVETSLLYTGAGVTVNFTQSGLPSGAVWSLTVGGYLRDGPANATLSLSGVPPSWPVNFTVSWVNTSYGVAWTPTATPGTGATFTANGAIAVAYSEILLLNIQTLPAFQAYYLAYYTNYNVAPAVGAYWYTKGTSVSLSIVPQTALFCYPCTNMSFVAWTGVGNGSYTGTSSSPTVTVNGPINETASFLLTGWCYQFPTKHCENYTYAQSFVENGLPIGTSWGVTVQSPNGSFQQGTSTASNISVVVPTGVASFTAWTIPSSTAGEYWVPNVPASPYFSAPGPIITVNYTLESLSGVYLTSYVEEAGLPNGTSWSFQVGSDQQSSPTPTAVIQAAAGSSTTVNASSVYFENGTGYYVSSVSVDPLVINATGTTTKAGDSVTIDGPAIIEYVYSPMYLVTSSATTGGTVSSALNWVPNGFSLSLTAAPSVGYHFVGWTGTGTGSVSSGTSTQITVKPGGPVQELATFRLDLPGTENLTLQSNGLPLGTPFTVVVGGVSYTSTTTIRIGNLSSGNYVVSAPTVSANSTNTTQYVVSGITSTAPLQNGVLNLTTNASLTVTYFTQYTLSVFATPGGSISGFASGLYWEKAGSSVTLDAVVNPGYYFHGWEGTQSGTSTQITVTVNGASNETAQFIVRPIHPPATYSLAVTETGLAPGTSWSLSVGTNGSVGTTATLTVWSLNGSYQVTAAPIYPSPGVRWISNENGSSVAVTQNTTLSVTYYEQYALWVGTSAGGSVSGAPASSWWNASGSVTLTASPNSTSTFVGWNGTGAGSQNTTATSITLTLTGAVSEQATFAPKVSTTTTTTSNTNAGNGEEITVILVVALLVVGLVVGLLVGRRRGGGGSSAPAPMEETPMAAEAPAPEPMAAPEPAPYDEGPPPA